MTLIRLILLICLRQIGSILRGYRWGAQAYQTIRKQAALPSQDAGQEDAPLAVLVACTSYSDQERYVVLCQLI